MIKAFFQGYLEQNLPYSPLDGQKKALELLSDFLFEQEEQAIFLLKGYAGTGKTSLVGAVVKALAHFDQRVVLMTPTGRAAKVFAAYAAMPASTIHKKIYRQRSYSESYEGFLLSDNLHKHTLFIVDEASMIANSSDVGSYAGSGRLLDDLIEYVYAGEGCKLLLVGDMAQLPPVGSSISPAMEVTTLEGYGLDVVVHELVEVARQEELSGILLNATLLREQMDDVPLLLPQLRFKGYPDVVAVSGEELVEELANSYNRVGMEQSIIVTRSNKRANLFNQGVRNQLLYREEELVAGDIILINKNNYYWCKEYKEIDFIANGDLARVVRVRGEQQLYGRRFVDVLLALPDYEIEIEAKVMLDTLTLESAALTPQQNNELYLAIMEDYPELTTKSARYKRLKSDPYFNALQVKYGYAITCHKAQGGEWRELFLDMGYLNMDALGMEFYRWLYTAITRASERLYVINAPKELMEE